MLLEVNKELCIWAKMPLRLSAILWYTISLVGKTCLQCFGQTLTRSNCHIPHRIISGLETRKQRGSPTSAGQAACLRAHDDQHQEQPCLDLQDVRHDDQLNDQLDDQHQDQPCLDQGCSST